MKHFKERLHKAVVIGASPAGIAATNKLGELGIPVTLIDEDADIDLKLSDDALRMKSGVKFNHAHRPGLIRILRNPGIKCVLPAKVTSIKHSPQGFQVNITQLQTFVDPQKCILCGRCVDVCPVNDKCLDAAIVINSRQSLPGRAVIEKRRLPLCRENCPLGVNVQGYVALVKKGKFKEALALIRQKNILPGICGRICTHPCESVCRRNDRDGAVAIRDIKRFLADYEADNEPLHLKDTNKSKQNSSQHIAIIGSGPAGLSAAAQLARQGCRVTIFEKEKQAGGLLRYGIGAHRLPRKIIDAELAYVENIGVEIVTDHLIDLKDGLTTLTEKFSAVVLASGAWADRKLGVPGEDLEGVSGCIDFLTHYHRGNIQSLKEKVAVVGDGNAAYDLARVLARLGGDVTIISWFSQDKIPADPEEIKAAAEEGIAVIDNTQVVSFKGEKGRFKQLDCRSTQPGKVDKNGIAWPVITKDSKSFTLEFERVFVAVGQTGALDLNVMSAKNRGSKNRKQPLQIKSSGLVTVNDQFKTNIDKVYAAGDAVSGASSVVHAMAHGRGVADRVLEDICGVPSFDAETVRSIDHNFTDIPLDLPFFARTCMPEKEAAERKHNFDEVALGLTESQTIDEAKRCLQCGVCSDCLECTHVCEAIGAINHNEMVQNFTEHAGVLIIADPNMAPSIKGEDIIRAYGPKTSRIDINSMITRGFAAAAIAMKTLSGTAQKQKGFGMSFPGPESNISGIIRTGIFACRCNDALGWHPGMDQALADLAQDESIVYYNTMPSACTPEGTTAILKTVREKGITRLVLAACVCCPLDFVCSSCTDQRSRLKNALFNATGICRSMVMTCNIKNDALPMLAVDSALAIERFTSMIGRAISRTKNLIPFSMPVRNYNFTTAVIGEKEAAVKSAMTLADAGIDVFMFGSHEKPLDGTYEHPNILSFKGSTAKNISGSLGNFQITIEINDVLQNIQAGAVILDEPMRGQTDYFRLEGGFNREITVSMQQAGINGIPFYYPGMTSVSGLFIADPSDVSVSNRQKGYAAAALAAAIMPRGPRQQKGYTVSVNADRCRGCGRCLEGCPYRAITMESNNIGGWHAVVDQGLCKGCGNCMSACPTNAADSQYRNRIFLTQTLEDILLQ